MKRIFSHVATAVLGFIAGAILHPCRPDPVPAGKPVPVSVPVEAPIPAEVKS